MSNAITTAYYDTVADRWSVLDPFSFNIVEVGSRGGKKYNPFGMVSYLECLGVVHDGVSFYQWQSDFVREPDPQERGGCYVRLTDEEVGRFIQKTSFQIQIIISKTDEQNTINAQQQGLQWQDLEPKLRHSFEDYYGKEHYQRYLDEDGNLSIVAFDNGWMNLSDSKHWYDYLEPDPCFFVTESDRIHTRHPYASQILTENLNIILSCVLAKDTIPTFYEIVGYILFSRTMFPPYIFHFYGAGRTGKSLLSEWIQDILGEENISRVSLLTLSKDFGAANLMGKRLNIATETETSQQSNYTPIDAEILKKLAGGETIQANRKFKSYVSFKNTAKLLFCSNSPFTLGDSSSGMNRRIITLPFRIPQEDTSEMKRMLDDQTTKLQLVEQQLAGWKRIIENKGITLSQSILEENKRRERFDSWNAFVQERWEGMSKRAILDNLDSERPMISDLYVEYVQYCMINKFMPLGKVRFNEKFTIEIGAKKKRVGTGLYWCKEDEE